MNVDKSEYGSSVQIRLNIRTNSLYQKEMDPSFILGKEKVLYLCLLSIFCENKVGTLSLMRTCSNNHSHETFSGHSKAYRKGQKSLDTSAHY